MLNSSVALWATTEGVGRRIYHPVVLAHAGNFANEGKKKARRFGQRLARYVPGL